MSLIIVIGRGHSGTRAISQTLGESGVFMGARLNVSWDLVPAEAMYDACRVIANYVRWIGDLNWDFSALHEGEIDAQFQALVRSYLKDVLASPSEHKGWKLPETTLAFPWIRRLFPEAKYIHWVRHPLDSILGGHLTDDLRDFGVPYPETDNVYERRAISWKYQYDIVDQTPKPENWITVRFEDFVLKQDETLARLESYLGFPLVKVNVDPSTIDRWRRVADTPWFDFLEPAARALGYAKPETSTVMEHLSC